MWLFVWVRVILCLIIFGTVAGFTVAPALGIPLTIPNQRLRQVDVTRLLSGQPVLGPGGRPAIDPAKSVIAIYAVQPAGPPQLRFRSAGFTPDGETIILLLTDPDVPYQAVIDAIETLRVEEHGAIWLTPMDVAGVRPNQPLKLTVCPVTALASIGLPGVS